jgi:hypothetical protein
MPFVTGNDNRSIEKQLLALSLGYLMRYPALYGIAFIPLKALHALEEIIEQAYMQCIR